MSVEERLKLVRPGTKVLTIQSHVVHGYAGNRCSVFPLQLHGFETDVVNSVQFSNHTGYGNGRVFGQKLTAKDLKEILEGLRINNLDEYSHLLTGYCGDVSFLEEISEFVKAQKEKNPNLLYVCDPVLGDDGPGYYTPKDLMPIYRDKLIKYSDVITPNAFELRELTGKQCQSLEECLEAVNYIHEKFKIPKVVVTSGISAPEGKLICLSSQLRNDGSKDQHCFTFPKVKGQYVGTGDIFASLILVWVSDTNGDLKTSVEKALLSLQSIIKRVFEKAYKDTSEPGAKLKELPLIESRMDLLCPSGQIECEKLG